MNCQYCQSPLPQGAKNCPGCGAPAPVSPPPSNNQNGFPQNGFPQNGFTPNGQNPAPGMGQGGQRPVNTSGPKSAGTAQILSCLIPGLGQIYNGQVAKGIVIIVANVIVGTLTSGIGSLAILVAAIVDAGKIAEKINAGRVVGEWEFF